MQDVQHASQRLKEALYLFEFGMIVNKRLQRPEGTGVHLYDALLAVLTTCAPC